MYVCEICPESNRVVLGHEKDLYSTEADVTEINRINPSSLCSETRCKVKIRYRREEQWATAVPVGEDKIRVIFDEPQRAVTPGQAAVFYDGETVLGGGIIMR